MPIPHHSTVNSAWYRSKGFSGFCKILFSFLILGGIWTTRSHWNTVLTRLLNTKPVEYVRVEGTLWHIDRDTFQKLLSPYTRGNIWEVDIHSLETVAKSFDWVDQVETSRLWPNILAVHVVEHRPVARWGQYYLLNDRGVRFSPLNISEFSELPQLIGTLGQEKWMLDTMRVIDEKLSSQGMHIKTLGLSKRLAWEAELDSGLHIIFGNQSLLPSLDRLLKLLSYLTHDKVSTIQRIDLRYPYGFSIVWKQESPLIKTPSGDKHDKEHPLKKNTLSKRKRLT